MKMQTHVVFLILLLNLAVFRPKNCIPLNPPDEEGRPLFHREIPTSGWSPTVLNRGEELSMYKMDVVLDTLRTHSLSCTYSLDYINTENVPLTELFFHLYPNAYQDEDKGLLINSLTDEKGNPFLMEFIGPTTLRVALETLLPPGSSINVKMEFEVRIPNISNRYGYWQNDNMTTHNLGNWYPIVAGFDETGWHTAPYAYSGESFYSDIANYQVNITVPMSEEVAATGSLMSKVPQGDGTTTWCWKAELVNDFVFSVSPDFQVGSKTAPDTTISSYYVATDAIRGERALEIAETCLKLFGQLYGPYPYATLSIVENPTINGGGMEYPTLVLMGSGLYRRASSITFESVLVHEIAHQWFPFLIGSNSFTEPFADEAFATFSEKIYWEFVYGSEAGEIAWQHSQNHYFSFLQRTGVDEIVNQTMAYWDRNDAYSPIVYSKGALILRMLRFVVSNDTFFRAMQVYYERFLHKNAKIRDLIAVFEEVTGTDLDWFFTEWVFRKGLPEYELERAEIERLGTAYELTIHVYQQTRYSGDNVFQMPIPIQIQYEQHKETKIAWVNLTSQEIRFTAEEKPVLVELDPQKIILRANFDQPLSQEVQEPKRLQEILLGLPTALIGAFLLGLGGVILLNKRRSIRSIKNEDK